MYSLCLHEFYFIFIFVPKVVIPLIVFLNHMSIHDCFLSVNKIQNRSLKKKKVNKDVLASASLPDYRFQITCFDLMQRVNFS